MRARAAPPTPRASASWALSPEGPFVARPGTRQEWPALARGCAYTPCRVGSARTRVSAEKPAPSQAPAKPTSGFTPPKPHTLIPTTLSSVSELWVAEWSPKVSTPHPWDL